MSFKPLFQWSDDFCVGVEEIDQQHQVLVDMLNDMHEAIVCKRGSAEARKILDQLADYTKTHFALEEGLMRIMRYPGFDIHKQQHVDLLNQVTELQEKLDSGKAAISFELLHFLKIWLSQHINESDKRYGAYFATSSHDGYSDWAKEAAASIPKRRWWQFWKAA